MLLQILEIEEETSQEEEDTNSKMTAQNMLRSFIIMSILLLDIKYKTWYNH